MKRHLVLGSVVIILAGVIATGVHVLSSRGKTTALATTAPAITLPPPSTTIARLTTTTALPTTTVTEPPPPPPTAPPTTRAPRPTAPPTTEAPTTTEPEPPPTTEPLVEVALYGDSLSLVAWERYQEMTAGERNTSGHMFGGAALPDWSATIQGDAIDRLVLALGTNDAQRDGAKPWADLLDALPETKCIVWPKTYEGSDEVAVFNTELTAIVAAHPNVHVIDWNAAAKAHPEWVGPDQIHYTDEGYEQYAAMLREAALTCP